MDIAVIARGRWDERRMVLLREKLEELNVPYEVDVVDFSVEMIQWIEQRMHS